MILKTHTKIVSVSCLLFALLTFTNTNGQNQRVTTESGIEIFEDFLKQPDAHQLFKAFIDHRQVTGSNCKELFDKGMKTSGVYTITPPGFPDGKRVLCDQLTDGGGWTILLNRRNDTITRQVDFARTFKEYSIGFGDLNTEFWIGNKILHAMTLDGPFTLRVEAKNAKREKRFAVWNQFSVGSEDRKFPLTVGLYSSASTLGDSLLTPQSGYTANGMLFSTRDEDNDGWSGGDCSVKLRGKGGWWFNSCGASTPTAPFGKTLVWGHSTAYWGHWDPTTVNNNQIALSEIQLKIRPPF